MAEQDIPKCALNQRLPNTSTIPQKEKVTEIHMIIHQSQKYMCVGTGYFSFGYRVIKLVLSNSWFPFSELRIMSKHRQK